MSVNKVVTKQRILNVLVAVVLFGGGIWLTLKIGPRPTQSTGSEKPANVAPAARLAVRSDKAKLDLSKTDSGLRHLELFGLAPFKVNGGHLSGTSTDFVAALEESYRARGFAKYERVSPVNHSHPGRELESGKFFWTDETPGFAMLSAVGPNADPDQKLTTGPGDLFLTVASNNPQGGTEWATYYLNNAVKEQQLNLESQDFPGEDPPSIPRLGGSRRLFSTSGLATAGNRSIAIYSSPRPVQEVADWYYQTLKASWQFDDLSTAQVRVIGDHLMCFTQQNQFCLVWIEANVETKTTMIVISVRYD